MYIVSTEIKENSIIPIDFTCDGADISPPLDLRNSPAKALSFTLIMEELDSPHGSFVHWVLYDWQPSYPHLDGMQPHSRLLSNGARQGMNDFDEIGYNGPCPVAGNHRYVFKLYALDKKLDLKPGANKAEVLKAMDGHILEESQFFAQYSRKEALKNACMGSLN